MAGQGTQHIGGRIRQLREKANMSLTDLSRESGISRGYLHLIEKGDSNPTQDKLVAIANALGILVSELIGEIRGLEDLQDIPDSLRQFAEEKGLPHKDVVMLSQINYRGQKPQTKEEWRLLYNVIKGVLDKE